TGDHALPRNDSTLVIYSHVHGGAVDKLRAFASSCPVRGADAVRRIDTVNSAESVAWLTQAVVGEPRFSDLAESEIAALAMHEDASATGALARLSDATHPRKLREQALFWSGQLRGADGARLAERVATGDADPDLRAHAVFVLSQVQRDRAGGMDGYASIHRIAQNDASEHVREQALFWMAQTGDARAKNDILAALGRETSERVREQAVFALSQLKDHEAEGALIGVVRGNYPRKAKEQALFWLGQSGSDRAVEFLDEVLTKGKPAHDT
ncbi:MAG TPA: HEAT repeat domain-containing protein, partial [Rudaea sp.]